MIPRPRPEVARLAAYVPGEQPAAGRRVIKLNTNEAAFPPAPEVVEAVRQTSLDALRRYPPPLSRDLREAAARRHGCDVDQCIVGNGSDDILTMIVRAFVPPGGTVASPWPTYSLYPTLCDIQGATFRPVQWNETWQLPKEALLETKPDAVFLANPNAPSGTMTSPEQIKELAQALQDRLLLIDEAYADYGDDPHVGAAGLINKHPNLVVSRSFSKGFALAGLRIGYALAHPEVAASLDKVRDSYNVDAVAQAGGLAALQEMPYYEQAWKMVRDARACLADALQQRGFAVTKSSGNFILARHAGATTFYRALYERGIFVRHWDKPDLREYLRITIGNDDDHQGLLAGLDEVLPRLT
jgi:histidinol-phosphate aminotransferase